MSEVLIDEAVQTTDPGDALDEALAQYQKMKPDTDLDESPGSFNNDEFDTGTEAPKPVDPDAPFGRFQNGKPRKRPAKNAKPSDLPTTLPASSLIDGGLLILLMDILFPLVIMFLHNRFANAGKISVERLQLTDKQKADLKPVADAAAQRLTLQMNPVWLLVVSMGGIYGMNYMTARLEAENV